MADAATPALDFVTREARRGARARERVRCRLIYYLHIKKREAAAAAAEVSACVVACAQCWRRPLIFAPIHYAV